ncbi:MAG: winged helix-turn-helix transcriptional regulator [Ruminococcaceae bacterium]|nr:winged helix-turn-helix transcriptional regulator [Oscillospiraceae bacterium]
MNDAWKALADPTRRRILELLRKRDMNAGEIAAEFDISKPSISNHLGILKSAGLVDTIRQGQNIIYSINTSVFEDILSAIYGFTKKGEDN